AITGNGTTGYVAGIIGVVYSQLGLYKMTNSGSVTSLGNYVAGIVGLIEESDLVVSEMISSGAITSSGRDGFVAGLIGATNKNITIKTSVSNSGNVTAEGSNIGGMFGYIKLGFTANAAVTIANTGSVRTNGENVGGVIGNIEGEFTLAENGYIYNETNSIDAKGDNVGGIIGLAQDKVTVNASNVVNSIRNTGRINSAYASDAGHNVGGIIGYAMSSVVLSRSILNSGSVIGEYNVGGVIGLYASTTDSLEFTNTISNSGSIKANLYDDNNSSYVGGVVGYSGSSILLSCSVTNSGAIDAVGKYISGMFGYVNGDLVATGANLSYESSGDINSATSTQVETKYIGGVAGLVTGKVDLQFDISTTGSISGQDYIGGVIGFAESTTAGVLLGDVENGDPYTTIAATGNIGYVGGVIGYTASSLNIVSALNNATISSKGGYVGGIAGRVGSTNNDDTQNMVIVDFATNSGRITATANVSNYVGGIVGYVSNNLVNNGLGSMLSNTNSVSASGNEGYIGGIAGLVFDTVDVSTIRNTGASVTSNNVVATSESDTVGYVAGLIGKTNIFTNNTAAYNTAEVSSMGNYIGGIVGYIARTAIMYSVENAGPVTSNG
ncbi:MAG: hypothetical protein IJW28_04030, partial [Clostridia bacterium]|nr:hypothetical protein [Clostridia bacterium]